MNVALDTSFLFSLYIQDAHSEKAFAYAKSLGEPLKIGSLLKFEFHQAIRFGIARKGLPEKIGFGGLIEFHEDLDQGIIEVIPCDWSAVHLEAEKLTTHYTLERGCKSLDLLHIATALTLGAKKFLTFDKLQSKLAQAEGLSVPW